MKTRSLDRRPVRWSLAAVLTAAAGVHGYLAVTESVIWPIPLAVLWLAFAVAVVIPAAEDVTVPAPRTAREALALTQQQPEPRPAHRPVHA
ncbi:hypothetical protein V5P93_005383 [Actinokineospora auranticolor]|uniref:Uncharacterized protein n=1 Tax=Actinokineospora auranticolor TaxID=155976 RepID=A0A2S6GQW6_9PSEU|nr:hypothetical protein [Actinokineospora auranticolor]PPK67590.1 hypothetical protein CLV40_107256 [Actinokineospora auranticolor]